MLAFAEEFVKFFSFKRVLKKRAINYSWADVVAFMVIIGIAFGLVEDIPYAIGYNMVYSNMISLKDKASLTITTGANAQSYAMANNRNI